MIRQAKAATDIPAIEAMLRDMHAASKYAGRVDICEKTMRELLLAMIAQQGQNGAQASFVRVAEEDGEPVGFVIGVLDRIYHIGKKLRANDVYLYVKPGAKLGHTLRLVDAYIGWALANPKVLEIVLSWTDTLPGAERIAKLYGRKGFTKCGEIYELRRDAQAMKEAA